MTALLRPAAAAAFACLALLAAPPARAVVNGEESRDPGGVRQSVVQVENSRGELCSGVVIARDLILTAAHCVLDPAAYRVVAVDSRFRRTTLRAVAAAMHPAFVAGTTPRTQPGVDLAILKLERALPVDFTPLDPSGFGRAAAGEPVKLAGFGVVSERNRRSGRTLRQTRLVTLGNLRVANTVLVAADRERLAETPGAGACLGDSGGPILREAAGGYQLIGVVSWASGALSNRTGSACGGLTAVTPVAEHASWISARAADLQRLTPGAPGPAPRAATNAFDWTARGR